MGPSGVVGEPHERAQVVGQMPEHGPQVRRPLEEPIVGEPVLVHEPADVVGCPRLIGARFSDVRQFEAAPAGWNSGWPVCHRQNAYMFAKFRNVTFLSSVKWPLS